ncbi:MAG: hypothetical protein CMH80_00790 [Nitrospinae bacterium]|jgi:hypothetical protein|nr:hypothetical protein [Nitrospinota bacterium]
MQSNYRGRKAWRSVRQKMASTLLGNGLPELTLGALESVKWVTLQVDDVAHYRLPPVLIRILLLTQIEIHKSLFSVCILAGDYIDTVLGYWFNLSRAHNFFK